MSATTQYTDFQDLYTGLQNRVRVTTGVTATENQSKNYINIALHDMHIGYGEKFPWAERTAILRTQAPYTTGTVATTKGSTTVTGSSTLWNTANDFSVNNVRAGGKMTFGGADTYEVSAIASDTSLTLTQRFISTSLAAGSSYTYFEDEYDLASDFLRPLDLTSFDLNGEVELVDRREFRRAFARNATTGRVQMATIVDLAPSGNTTPRRRVRFWKAPGTNYLLTYAYVTSNLATSSAGAAQAQLSAATDEPIVPLAYRHVIVLHALYHWYRDKKDDARSQEVKGEYTDLILRIVGDNEDGQRRPHVHPRVGAYVHRATRPWSGGSGVGRYSDGTRFDELR